MKRNVRRIWNAHREKILLGLCMLVSLLALTGILTGDREMSLEALERPSLSEGNIVRDLVVVREDGSRETIHLNLSTRKYTEAEAEVIFAKVSEHLPELIRADNASLLQVRSDLELPDRIDDLGVDLSWKSDSPEIISSSGKLQSDRGQSNTIQVSLEVTMKLQSYFRTEKIRVEVLPVAEPSWEERLQQELARLEADAGGTDELTLPDEFEGEAISFVQQADISRQTGVALLPMMVGLLLYMNR